MNIKCCTIGDGGVGKSSLCASVQNKTYTPIQTTTLGVDFYIISSPDCCIRLWDTAGAERYSTFTTQYFRHAQFIIACWDTTNIDTLLSLKTTWLPMLKEGPRIIMMGLKADELTFEQKIECAQQQRQHVPNASSYAIVSSKDPMTARNHIITQCCKKQKHSQQPLYISTPVMEPVHHQKCCSLS